MLLLVLRYQSFISSVRGNLIPCGIILSSSWWTLTVALWSIWIARWLILTSPSSGTLRRPSKGSIILHITWTTMSPITVVPQYLKQALALTKKASSKKHDMEAAASSKPASLTAKPSTMSSTSNQVTGTPAVQPKKHTQGPHSDIDAPTKSAMECFTCRIQPWISFHPRQCSFALNVEQIYLSNEMQCVLQWFVGFLLGFWLGGEFGCILFIFV